MKVTFIGAGYVGLVSGILTASFGNDVSCVDTDKVKIDKLLRGELPIYEPGLQEYLNSGLKNGNLTFTTNASQAIEEADVVFMCVGTPQAEDGSADLSAIYQVARTIGETLRRTQQPNKVIVVKSTVPVGTTQSVAKIIDAYVDVPACIASNPEFLREGTAVEDFMRPDRVVIGTDCDEALSVLIRLYKSMTPASRILTMNSASSELIKYASNAYLATRISFINELSNLSIAVGADINQVRDGLGSDSRIGPKYLYPGPGFGGSCLPKDISALITIGKQVGVDMTVSAAALQANEKQRRILAGMVRTHFNNMLTGKIVALWGLSFKAETDDIRESPAVIFCDEMLSLGARVVIHDPQAMERGRDFYGKKVTFVDDMYDACNSADILAVCTEWRQYRLPDITEIQKRSPNITVFDGRNVWDKSEFTKYGIPYFGICSPPVKVSLSSYPKKLV